MLTLSHAFQMFLVQPGAHAFQLRRKGTCVSFNLWFVPFSWVAEDS